MKHNESIELQPSTVPEATKDAQNLEAIDAERKHEEMLRTFTVELFRQFETAEISGEVYSRLIDDAQHLHFIEYVLPADEARRRMKTATSGRKILRAIVGSTKD